jgi:hypothetical protein
MEHTGIGQDNQRTEKNLRRPYHTPQLVNLGEIQSIVQGGNMSGNEAGCNGVMCAVS